MTQTKEFSKILQILQNMYSSEHPLEARFSPEKIKDIVIKECSSEALQKRLISEFTDCGPLYKIIEDPHITEIIIQGPEQIFYEKVGENLKILEDSFLSQWTFTNFIHRLCPQNKTTLQYPFTNGRWKNFRVHVIAPPITKNFPHITLRRHPTDHWTLSRLQTKNWAPPPVFSLISDILKHKMNILIAGPTSSGKTSFMSACLQACSSHERMIILEDTDEIVTPNPFSIKLLTRLTSHLPEIDLSTLVQQSLRMRPDRLIMGEVRGKEAKDLILALATGHQGSIGTLHADHHKQALLRLELLVQSANLNWEKSSIRHLIQLGIQIIFILKKQHHQRYLHGIYQLTGLESTGFLFDTLFQHDTKVFKSLRMNSRRS